MFQREEIMFRRHTVLKAEMLSLSSKAPMEYLELQYHDWSDGILSGADILVGENDLTIQPGIVIHQGKMFRMTEEEHIPYQANGKEMKLLIHFDECKEMEEGKFFKTDFILTENEDTRAGDMELVRFCLQEGAILRDDYKSFADINTQYNTMNYLYGIYAGYKSPTLSPVIIQEYAKEASHCAGLDTIDFAFLLVCNQGENISKNSICMYIEQKLQKELPEDITNLELFHELKKVLEIIRRPRQATFAVPRRKTIID